jgi:hypothetical protein
VTALAHAVEWREEDGELRPHLRGSRKRIAWAPQAGSQDALLSCPVTEALYEGNRGPGKTDGLLMDFARDVDRGFGPDWRGILFRRSYPELKDIIAKSLRWFPEIFPGARFNKQTHEWTFPGGEVLILSFMERPSDYYKHHGHAYPWIGWEELTNWPSDECYRLMFSCLRSSSPKVAQRARVRATCNPYGCVPFGDVLTDEGWTDIRDIRAGDKVLTVAEDGLISVGEVSQLHRYDFDGELITRRGRGLEMVFTPEHRFPLLNTARTSHTLRAFTELPGQAVLRRAGDRWKGGPGVADPVLPGYEAEYAREPKARVPSIPLAEYAELLGWMASEGCVAPTDGAFCIAQTKEHNVARIGELLDRCGFHWRYDGQQFWVSERSWMMHFAALGKCRDKHLPKWFKSAPSSVLERCLESLMLGDGSGHVYYTTSQVLSDDVAEIATKLGYAVYISSRQREGRVGLSYQINLSRNRATQLNTGNHVYDVETQSQSLNCARSPFRGDVYCLSVPGTETFFVRQHGCVWLSGNSGHNWVKARFHLPVPAKRVIGPLIRTPSEPDRIAIHGHLRENRILLHADPTYEDRLRAAARNPSELAAWLDGSWDIVAGGMFDDVWLRDIHVVPPIPLRAIPRSWRLDRAYDDGQSRPFSVGWWAQSSGEPVTWEGRSIGEVRGDLVRVAEWYGWNGTPNEGLRMASKDIAKGIVEREKAADVAGRVLPGPADASIYNADPRDPRSSIASDMEREGVRWDAADKRPGSRKQGWQQLRKLLKEAAPDQRTGRRESPGLFISAACSQFLRTFPTLPRDDRDLDDVDTESEDHIADETRYRCRHAPRAAKSSYDAMVY